MRDLKLNIKENPFLNRKKIEFTLNNKIIACFIKAVPYELANSNIGYEVEFNEIKLVICPTKDGWIQINKKSELVSSLGNQIEQAINDINQSNIVEEEVYKNALESRKSILNKNNHSEPKKVFNV